MDPWIFRRLVVIPNLEEMIADFGDVRRATNCIFSIDALAAHIFYFGRANFPDRDNTAFRERLAERNNDFRILRDVAKGIKHCRLTRRNALITGSASVDSMGVGPVGSGYWDDDAVWNDEARWNNGPEELLQVIVELSGGNVRTIEAIANSVIKLLDQELAHISASRAGRSP